MSQGVRASLLTFEFLFSLTSIFVIVGKWEDYQILDIFNKNKP